MDFALKCIITNEFKEGALKFDLNEFESFISEKLIEKNYGSAVVKYFWGFELYKFDGGFAKFFYNDIESWRYSTKFLITNSHFDWNIVSKLTEQELIELIPNEFINSIKRIPNLKRKPKNFDFILFIKDVENIILEYKLKKRGLTCLQPQQN